jgi:hypothetical protein
MFVHRRLRAPVVAQDFPGRLLEALPNAAEKLASEDVAVRASILSELGGRGPHRAVPVEL